MFFRRFWYVWRPLVLHVHVFVLKWPWQHLYLLLILLILILGQGPPPPPSGKHSLLFCAKLSGIDKLLIIGKEVSKSKRSELILQPGLWKQHSDFFYLIKALKVLKFLLYFKFIFLFDNRLWSPTPCCGYVLFSIWH